MRPECYVFSMSMNLFICFVHFRRRHARAESSKLAEIQKELSHLDSLLSADVSILRNKIETASREFMEAQ